LQPLALFMPPRIGAPDRTNSRYRAANDGLLELVVPTICRKHSPKRDAPLSFRPGSTNTVRVRRVLAFLVRCFSEPTRVITYSLTADMGPWMPVPEWNFKDNALASPEITRLREWLGTLGIAERVFTFSGPYAQMPWEIPAVLAAERFETYKPEAHAGVDAVMDFARRCASTNARDDKNSLVRLVARRVAHSPDPLDVYPWAPRWAPATQGMTDRSVRPGGKAPTMPRELRGWWNFNALVLHPRGFDPQQADHHLRLIEQNYTDVT
jgi:hypothetical protein